MGKLEKGWRKGLNMAGGLGWRLVLGATALQVITWIALGDSKKEDKKLKGE